MRYCTVSTVGIKLGSRRRHRIHNTSLLLSICGPSAVTSIEYTFFSRRISLRYLLASLSFPHFFFLLPLCFICACSVFYLHILLLSVPAFSLSFATVVICIQDCSLVSFRGECIYVCFPLLSTIFIGVRVCVTRNDKPWNTSLIVRASFRYLPGLKSFFIICLWMKKGYLSYKRTRSSKKSFDYKGCSSEDVSKKNA